MLPSESSCLSYFSNFMYSLKILRSPYASSIFVRIKLMQPGIDTSWLFKSRQFLSIVLARCSASKVSKGTANATCTERIFLITSRII